MSEENDNKPNLDVPEHLEYSDEHVWWMLPPSRHGGYHRICGDQLGELVYIDLPEVGTEVQAGDEVAELESSKAVTPLVAPGGRRDSLCEQRGRRRSKHRNG